MTLDGVARTPSTDTATYFFSSDIKFMGAESGGRAANIEVVRHTDLPVSAKAGDGGEIVQYLSYSDSTKKTQVSTTTERWSLVADSQSPTGVSFQIVRATVFTDPAQSRDPLVYTDRYTLAANGSVEFTSRTVYLFTSSGTTNLSYSFATPK